MERGCTPEPVGLKGSRLTTLRDSRRGRRKRIGVGGCETRAGNICSAGGRGDPLQSGRRDLAYDRWTSEPIDLRDA
jgi:hypothetical protein